MTVYISLRKRDEANKKDRLIRELLDAVLAAETALRAGSALESAFLYAEDELRRLWGGGSNLLFLWSRMNKRIAVKEPAVKAFGEMAAESKLRELTELAELTDYARRTGGGLSGLMGTFASQLEQKIGVERAVRAELTEKRMEKNMMLLLPLLILAYLNLTSYEWVGPLYEAHEGRAFMTVCLLVYGAAFGLGEKYMRITV